MENIKRLFQILGKWKKFYILSAVMLIISTLVRMLEPKVLQIAVDKVIVYFQSGGKITFTPDDSITKFFYSIIPDLRMDNLQVILISLGIIFLVISLLRGLFSFSASAISCIINGKSH